MAIELAEQIMHALILDGWRKSNGVAVIEGVLAEWHCTDDAKGLNALMRLNKKQGDEIERLRAAIREQERRWREAQETGGVDHSYIFEPVRKALEGGDVG